MVYKAVNNHNTKNTRALQLITAWLPSPSIVRKLVHVQVTIIFVVPVCLFVCAEFFSAVFDPISIKL